MIKNDCDANECAESVMKVARYFFYAIAMTGVLVACSNGNGQEQDAGTPGRRHHLTEEQIRVEEEKANAGDAKAVTRLINYYQWAVSDREKAFFWLRRGVELGDPYAMINLSSQLAAKSDESSCKEAETLLVRVLESAPKPDTAKIARTDLQTLREGVDGTGSCTEWL